MEITIAGFGSIGQFTASMLGRRHKISVYDPPKGLGSQSDLINTDFVVISVPTPSLKDGSCDVSRVEEVVSLAAPRRAILCHSTVSIGTTERLLGTYEKPLVYVPEYAGETEDHPFRRPENRRFFFLGGYEPQVSAVRSLLETVYPGAQFLVQPPAAVEVAKYMENAFLALKVGFCNEFFDLCQALGIEYDVVRSLWLQDFRITPSHTMVTEERGYGGKCFPKDVAAVCSTARRLGAPVTILEALQKANERHRATGATGARGEVLLGAGAGGIS